MNHKLAAVALIYKDIFFQGKLIGVSRKNDPNDFGLPGGKLEGNESLYEAMVREVKEETGLVVKKAIPLFFRECDGFLSVVYLVEKYEGVISTKEEGVVKWITFDDLKKGTFGEYNANLEEHIKIIRAF
jgi:8-oxo-dGTP pyrophosphatase MutT (NUDIX family)